MQHDFCFSLQATGRITERWINGHSLIHLVHCSHFFNDLRKMPTRSKDIRRHQKCSDVHMTWPAGQVEREGGQALVPKELLPRFIGQVGNKSDAHPSMKVIDGKDIDVVAKFQKVCATSCEGSWKSTTQALRDNKASDPVMLHSIRAR